MSTENRSILWEEIRNEVEEVRKSMCYAIDHFLAQSDLAPLFLLAEYEYCESIIEEGTPLLPGGERFPADFLTSEHLPLGIVLSNCAEVSVPAPIMNSGNSKPRAGAARRRSSALLGAGSLLGLFEVLDKHVAGELDQHPDWSISAGASNIYSLNQMTMARHKNLERTYPGVADFNSVAVKSVGQSAMLFKDKIESLQDWHTKVLFFSREFLDRLYAHRAPEESSARGVHLPEATARLQLLLLEQAWPAVTKIRDIHTMSSSYIAPPEIDARKASRESTQLIERIFISLVDCFLKRLPIYVPDTENNQFGPFEVLVKEYLEVAKMEPVILRPAHPDEAWDVGYLPLELIAPELRSDGARPTFHRALGQMLQASEQAVKAAQEKKISPLLREVREIIPRISLRTPTQHSNTVTQYSIRENGTVTAKEATDNDFFKPYFDSFPPERCDFFRYCLRIEYR